MIAIVGAGPIGCFLGYLLAKQGKEVNIYEEHYSIGKPVHCTGIVTKELSKIIPFKEEFVINKLNYARISSYNNSVDIPLEEYILDRVKFDQYLADLAVKNGAKLITNTKVIDFDNNKLIIKTKKGIKNIKADIIIGTDGPYSVVAKKINKSKRDYYTGIQARVKGKFDPRKYKTYFGNICPNFFAWVVPESKNIARIGLACKKEVNYYFSKLLAKLNIKNKDIFEKQGGLIPIYNKKDKVQQGNIYLVGDAAGQVKATTGGGLVFGLKSAQILADCILNKKNYRKNLSKLNRELYIHLKIRSILNKFNDKDFSYLVKILKKKKVQNILQKSSREYPSKLAIKLLFAEPRFLLFAKKIF